MHNIHIIVTSEIYLVSSWSMSINFSTFSAVSLLALRIFNPGTCAAIFRIVITDFSVIASYSNRIPKTSSWICIYLCLNTFSKQILVCWVVAIEQKERFGYQIRIFVLLQIAQYIHKIIAKIVGCFKNFMTLF